MRRVAARFEAISKTTVVKQALRTWFGVLLCAGVACQRERHDYSATSAATETAPVLSGPSVAASNLGLPSTASEPSVPVARALPREALSREAFAELVRAGSEKGEYFFSDNLISNETAYQKPADLLSQLAVPGQAYLGVGPEQNFSFIGWVDPSIAFVIDIRRDNLLQHLWYKAMFELSSSRTEYLCLWLGRRYDVGAEPGPKATIDGVLDAASRAEKSAAAFAAVGRRIDERLAQMGLALDAADRKRILHMRQSFFEHGLGLRFELHEATSHEYPTLQRILAEEDDRGTARSFLAEETLFRRVQTLQQQNLLIPLVGDFAGEHAMSTVAHEVERRGLFVALFYTSNVEQYLFEGDSWGRWVHNLGALPTEGRSLLARVHLDQGQPHPSQVSGHRSTMVLQRFEQFFEHQRRQPYRDAFQLVTEDTLIVQ